MKLKKPWEKWPDESIKAYQYFIGYLELGKKRSLENVRRKYSKNTSYKRQLARWSSKHNWVERVNAYDLHMTQKALKGRAEIIDHAMARLLMQLDEALDQLFEIMALPNFVENESTEYSIISHKIKIIHDLMDRVGLVAFKEPIKTDSDRRGSDFVQRIYQRIADLDESKKTDKG